MTKTDINKIEKQFMKDTVANLKNWADDKFVGGGVEIDQDLARVDEDFKHTLALNSLTKMVPQTKIQKIQKSVTFDSTFGYHNAASATLETAIKKLTALAK